MAKNKNDGRLDPTRPRAAYLIRCWREADTWRYSVEEVASRQRRRFDSLEAMLTALRKQVHEVAK